MKTKVQPFLTLVLCNILASALPDKILFVADSDPFDSLRALFGGVQVNSTAEKGAEIVELAQADAAANDTDQSPVVSLENDDSLNAPGRDARSPLHFGECDSTVRLGHEVELSFDSSRADNDEAVHDVENVGTDGNQGTERNGYPQGMHEWGVLGFCPHHSCRLSDLLQFLRSF